MQGAEESGAAELRGAELKHGMDQRGVHPHQQEGERTAVACLQNSACGCDGKILYSMISWSVRMYKETLFLLLDSGAFTQN